MADDYTYINQIQNGKNFQDNLPFETSWHIFFLSPMMFAVLFMVCGFTFLQTGHCRSTNVKSIIAKVLVGIMVTILVWWFWGWGFAMGQPKFNLWDFDFNNTNKFPSSFYYLLVLCLLCTTIISGAVTDRMQIWTYGLVIASVAGASFPLIVNWVVVPHVESFNGSGWLVKRGVIDICGAGYIHVIGGLVGTLCARHCGPREGRFLIKDGKRVIVNALPYDAMSATAGTWILIFGWFNYIALCSLQAWGDDKHQSDDDAAFHYNSNFNTYFYPAFRAVINGAIAMAASGFVSTVLLSIVRGQASYSLPLLNNALIGGLVGISAACLNADTMGSFFIGVGSGIIAYLGPNVCVALGIDDARDVFTVHFLQGFWAVFVTGLWALHMQNRPTGFLSNDDTFSTLEALPKGAFYSGSGVLLGYQMVYLVCTIIPTIMITCFALHLSKFISTHFFTNLFPADSNPNTNVSEEWHEDISTEFPYLSSSSANLVPSYKVCKHFHEKCGCKKDSK